MARRPACRAAGPSAACTLRAAIAVRFRRPVFDLDQPPCSGATPSIHDAPLSASYAHTIHARAADLDDQGSPRVEAGRTC